MSKYIKGSVQKAPLSTADKVIYGMIVASAFLWLLIFILWEDLLYHRAYHDPTVIACNLYDYSLCIVPLCLLASLLPLFLSALGISLRQPLLKSKSRPIPAFTHVIKTDPFFSQAFWTNLSAKKRKTIRNFCITTTIAFALCLFLASFSLYPRQVLTQTHTFVTYNSFNKPTSIHTLEDAKYLKVQIVPKMRSGYTLCLEWGFDGTYCSFTPAHFGKMSREEALRYLLLLKSTLPPERIQFFRPDLVQTLADYQHYTNTEADLLYQLFDVTP